MSKVQLYVKEQEEEEYDTLLKAKEKSCKYKSMTCPDECKEIKKRCIDCKHPTDRDFYNNKKCKTCKMPEHSNWEPRE